MKKVLCMILVIMLLSVSCFAQVVVRERVEREPLNQEGEVTQYEFPKYREGRDRDYKVIEYEYTRQVLSEAEIDAKIAHWQAKKDAVTAFKAQ